MCDYNLEYVEFFHSKTETARYANRSILSDGVKLADCCFAGELFFAPIPVELKRMLNARCCPDENIGTVEVYSNGGVNAFLNRKNVEESIGVFKANIAS
jgi:hypothetical protein